MSLEFTVTVRAGPHAGKQYHVTTEREGLRILQKAIEQCCGVSPTYQKLMCGGRAVPIDHARSADADGHVAEHAIRIDVVPRPPNNPTKRYSNLLFRGNGLYGMCGRSIGPLRSATVGDARAMYLFSGDLTVENSAVSIGPHVLPDSALLSQVLPLGPTTLVIQKRLDPPSEVPH